MGARAEVEVEMMVAELLADQAPWARPTDVEPPDPMGLTAALVLLHVDGVASVEEIARSSAMSVAEVVACVYELLAWGVVEIAFHDAPESAVRLRQSETAVQLGSRGNR